MSLSTDFLDFLFWWRHELRQLLPQAIRARLTESNELDWTFSISREEICLDRKGNDEARFFLHGDQRLLATEIIALSPAGSCKAEIILTPGCFLERELAPFRLPRQRARAMAKLDIVSSTPLDPDAIVTLFPLEPMNDADTRYFVVKKQTLEPLLVALDEASIQLVAMKAAVNDHNVRLDPVDWHQRLGLRKTRSRKAMLAGMMAVAVSAVATYAHAQWRYSDALRYLDGAIDRLEADAREVQSFSDQRKNRIKQVEDVREQKKQAVPVVLLWEELTRVMPDDAWVTDFAARESKLILSGYSASAAGLLPLLEDSSFLQNPTFTAPVVKVPGTKAERFTIEAEIVR